MIFTVISPGGEDTHTLCLTSKLVDLRVGYAKRIRREKLVEPRLFQLRNYDATECIIVTEGYRSGHNEAVLKTVWEQSHVGSNPTPSAKTRADHAMHGLLLFLWEWKDENSTNTYRDHCQKTIDFSTLETYNKVVRNIYFSVGRRL